jgi:hypothetical protein
MNVYRKASNLLVLALMGIALWVFIGKAYDEDMWLAVALYWAVLTVKNLCDWIALRENKRDE